MCRLRRRRLPCRVLVLLAALAFAGCASTTNHAFPVSVGDNQATPGASPRYQRASADQPGAPRRLSSAEEEWVIARAIAEHEMRRP